MTVPPFYTAVLTGFRKVHLFPYLHGNFTFKLITLMPTKNWCSYIIRLWLVTVDFSSIYSGVSEALL